ncbi:hypothetical protein B0H21DRAFT_812447 [Amylocystis lapponica]|nr:hypothetical protein B0H21DRAFT_812447 [Amylocystis lapponica]
MKSLRKSLNGNKDHAHHISTPAPLPALSKPATAIIPPKRVIKALSPYRSTAPQELSFEKGDFFHVLNDVNSAGAWYEAHNPMTGARGLVPRSLFEEFQKGAAAPRATQVFGNHTARASNTISIIDRPKSAASSKTQAFYAIVLHDFIAERADELGAKAGDPITVVAQSNREWFVAKPIGRLGRPGLIPVTFVEIRDPATSKPPPDVFALIDSGALPSVEEWKRAMMNYKASSISLGVLDDSPGPNIPPVPKLDPAIVGNSPPLPHKQQQLSPAAELARSATPPVTLPNGILLTADVKSFHYEMDEYWFRVYAVYQPYGPSEANTLPPAKQLVLFRSYNDFYDFQVELLDAFPHEAGRPDTGTRILPYMPGPAQHVDNEITINRRAELADYLHKLCELQTYARYILEHRLIRGFLELRPGDVGVEVEPRIADIEAIFQASYAGQEAGQQNGTFAEDGADERLSNLKITEGTEEPPSDGSDYEEEGDVMGRAFQGDSYDYQSSDYSSPRQSTEHGLNTTAPLRPKDRAATSHDRPESNASYRRPSHAPPQQSYSRAFSPTRLAGDIQGRLSDSGRSYSSLDLDPYSNGTDSRSSTASSHVPSPTSLRSSQATSATSASGRSRSHSNAAKNPPISATNQQLAYLKIKIFDRVADDLVAIRVHPRVTHGQLMEKVHARLGEYVVNLRYRDSMSNEFVGLESDDELRDWLNSTDRHVLYAE